jgi:hypothetical protein
MKTIRYFVFLMMLPYFSWAATHVINQTFFLNSKPGKSWTKKDTIFVMGAERVDVATIAMARKNFPKSMPIYWLMSDDQWYYSNVSLNKDQMAIDFARQMEELYIRIVPADLCPKPAVFNEKKFDIVVIDSNWFLFPHKNELFSQQCGDVDLGKYYTLIEEALLNAKLKPVVMISHHGVNNKVINNPDDNSVAKFANTIQQSLGPMDSISNPAYQKYQEKIIKMLSRRPNVMFISTTSESFFEDTENDLYHVALPNSQPSHLQLDNIKTGVSATAEDLLKKLQLEFNEKNNMVTSICEDHTGSMHEFKLKGSFYEYFLGSNYRKLWNQPITIDCFDLQEKNLTITRMGGSLGAPDFQLKDLQGNFYTLKPMKKAVRLPQILEDTLVEKVLRDQQSSLNPVGFLLAASLATQAKIPNEFPKLVYIDVNQNAFSVWKNKKVVSGFYQLVQDPVNILNNRDSTKNGVLEVVSTQEMVHRLENESGYTLDQTAYLKARLFDILIGDSDRGKDQWMWMVVVRENGKVFYPYPIDHEGSFYRGDGAVSWWRQRKWVNYRLQNYGNRLKHPNPMMIESFSMDHRFTFKLTKEDWDHVLADLLQKLPPDSMEKALEKLPIKLSERDRKWLIESFQKRLKDLPNIAGKMRMALLESVDIVGTSSKDNFLIQSGPGPFIEVTNKNESDEIISSNKFDSKTTKEIRIYGLGGDDDYRLDWKKYVSTKTLLIPGDGKDNFIEVSHKIKPKVELYDDNTDIISYYGFKKRNYEPGYNDYYSHINRRSLNVLEPVLFLASSNPDSGFVIGGGVKYNKTGFQKSPWSSTNEFKANLLVSRAAANVFYKGTWFDVVQDIDLQTEIDFGIPRFYGSFFGLGNTTPNRDPSKEDEFYWMKARHLETASTITIPIIQHLTLVPRAQFRFRDYQFDDENILTTPSESNLDSQLGPGTTDNMQKPNYYMGGGASVKYISDDDISGPIKKRIVRAEASWMLQQGLASEDSRFQTVDASAGLTGYFSRSKTQWKINGGFGKNFGNWEFFDAQFLGQGQNLRGYFINRFGGDTRIYDSFEINQSLLFRKRPIITDYGIGAFFDHGRVYMTDDPNSDKWHKAIGGQAWITALNSIAFKFGYAHAIYEDQKGLWSFVLTTEL